MPRARKRTGGVVCKAGRSPTPFAAILRKEPAYLLYTVLRGIFVRTRSTSSPWRRCLFSRVLSTGCPWQMRGGLVRPAIILNHRYSRRPIPISTAVTYLLPSNVLVKHGHNDVCKTWRVDATHRTLASDLTIKQQNETLAPDARCCHQLGPI